VKVQEKKKDEGIVLGPQKPREKGGRTKREAQKSKKKSQRAGTHLLQNVQTLGCKGTAPGRWRDGPTKERDSGVKGGQWPRHSTPQQEKLAAGNTLWKRPHGKDNGKKGMGPGKNHQEGVERK